MDGSTYVMEHIPFNYRVGDILVVRPGDMEFERQPTTFRVLARVAEDYGAGFVIIYQVRSCSGSRNYSDAHDLKTLRQEELMLYTAYDSARILTEKPVENAPAASSLSPSSIRPPRVNRIR